MKHLYTIVAILCAISLASCKDSRIYVTNKIQNVQLENVSFGEELGITSGLLPGETDYVEIDENTPGVDFPMTKHVRFYMVKGDSRVLLYTKEYYTVEKDDELRIILTDDTEVVNPLNPISSRIASIKEIDVLQPEE